MAPLETSIQSRPEHQMHHSFTPTQQVSRKELANELGVSGTPIVDGFLNVEYNASLKGTVGLDTYDAMRKSDAQINATLMVLELPVRSTTWYIKPATNDDGESDEQDHEIAKFVHRALFQRMEITFDDVLREILTMLPFGFSVLEKVWEIGEDHVWIKKLASRKQTTIHRWQTAQSKPGIVQLAPLSSFDNKNDTYERSIPAGKLLIFTYRKEGDNYLGTSVLRSAYKHWFIKDQLYRFDMVRHERQSVGIPVVRLPTNWTAQDKAEAEAIVRNVRATEQTGIVLPGSEESGWNFFFADTQAGNSTPIFESVNHHNREIAKNVLAQFLELGQESGSRALSEDHSELLMLCEDALAKQVKETLNRYLIRELVDYNYNVDDERYPTLEYDPVGFIDWTTFTSALATAAGGGLLTPDDDLEAHLRTKLKLPPKMKVEEVEDEMTDEEGNPIDDTGLDEEPVDDDGDDLDDLQSEIDELDASAEDDDEEFAEVVVSLCEEMEHQLDLIGDELEMQMSAVDEGLAFVARGGTVPLATRQKIAKTLRDKKIEIEERNLAQQRGRASDRAKGRKGGDTKSLIQTTKSLEKNLNYQKGAISARQEQYKREAASIRSEIDAIKAKGKVKKGQLKPLMDRIRALKNQRDSDLAPLREMRAKDLQTKKAVTALLKQRKIELKAKIKAIRDQLKAKKITRDAALKPLKDQVSANTAKMRELRAEMKRAGSKDRKAALRAAIDGLRDESASVRDAMRGIRDDYRAESESGRAAIDKEKESSGFAEGGDDDDMDPTEDVAEHHLYNADAAYQHYSALIDNSAVLRIQNECSNPEEWAKAKKKGFRFNDYESNAWRPLTFAERKVNFGTIIDALTTFEEKLNAQLDEITEKQKQDLIAQVKRAVENNDVKALGLIKAKYRGEISQAMTDIQKELFEIGRKGTATEMSVPLPATRAEVKGAMRVANDAVVNQLVSDMENDVKRVVTAEMAKHGGSITATNSAAAVGAVTEALEKTVETAKRTATGLVISGSLNLGRASIFERYPEKVYGFQFSAILDAKTSDICISLDGTVVPAGSRDYYDLKPPRHLHCRSLWIAILKEEAFKPKFTKVSPRIPRDTDLTKITPLKTPVLRKGAPAVKIIQQEIADRKTKLAQLEEAGKFPNRQKQHRESIKRLESAIKGKFHEYCRDILAADGIQFKD